MLTPTMTSANSVKIGTTVEVRQGQKFADLLKFIFKGSPMLRFAGALLTVFLATPVPQAMAQEGKPLPHSDERYKADILVVVAHPDDEAAVTPYLVRALDEHRRVAVVFATRGSSGSNEAGAEQAAALGDVREIEARNALATLGINTVWFLSGKDTATQDVLVSLANWDHGETLEQMVRLVRLTRPEVILTFLPGAFIGEDHGDHQASGVLATEAFDLAGNPAVFPEQVAGPMKRLEPFLADLRPWQAKKIYYFPDADREDIFRGKGPSYSVKEVSRLSNKPYWRMALDAFRAHQTQAKSYLDKIAQMDEAQIERMATSEDGWGEDQHFVLGKSLVGGSVSGDIFEEITPGAIPYARPEAVPEPAKAQEVTLSATLPAGWTTANGSGRFTVAARRTAAARVEVSLPALPDKTEKKTVAQEVTVRAEANGQVIGEAKLRVELRKRALPE